MSTLETQFLLFLILAVLLLIFLRLIQLGREIRRSDESAVVEQLKRIHDHMEASRGHLENLKNNANRTQLIRMI